MSDAEWQKWGDRMDNNDNLSRRSFEDSVARMLRIQFAESYFALNANLSRMQVIYYHGAGCNLPVKGEMAKIRRCGHCIVRSAVKLGTMGFQTLSSTSAPISLPSNDILMRWLPTAHSEIYLTSRLSIRRISHKCQI